MEILCLGNEHIETDSIGPYVAENLKIEGISFKGVASVDEFERLCEKHSKLVIIDSAEGIDTIKIMDNVNQLSNHPRYSLHDYDIGFSMRLMEKLGTLPKIQIIAIPTDMPKAEVMSKLPRIIESLSN